MLQTLFQSNSKAQQYNQNPSDCKKERLDKAFERLTASINMLLCNFGRAVCSLQGSKLNGVRLVYTNFSLPPR